MITVEVVIALILIGAFIYFQFFKRKINYKRSLLTRYMGTSDEMKRTLAAGIYLRFKKENEEKPPDYSSVYVKQNPLLFENFAAEVVQKARGGSTWVSPLSGDYGVDFEHRTKEGLFLGQVKCHEKDLSYQPIALIHSNMIKQEAKGGYVITTSSFTSAARRYAEGLDIELIDGVKLVEIWLHGLTNTEKNIKKHYPDKR